MIAYNKPRKLTSSRERVSFSPNISTPKNDTINLHKKKMEGGGKEEEREDEEEDKQFFSIWARQRKKRKGLYAHSTKAPVAAKRSQSFLPSFDSSQISVLRIEYKVKVKKQWLWQSPVNNIQVCETSL